MLGIYEGSPAEVLQQAAAVFAALAPQASCALSPDGRSVVCQARRPDGELHVERLPTAYLPAEVVRHAAMKLGMATHPPESIGDWERWASAWHVIQVHGTNAVAHVDERIAQLEEDGSAAGVDVFRALRSRVQVLQAEPGAWAGQA